MNNVIWHLEPFDKLQAHTLYKIIKVRVDVFVVEQDCPYPDLDDKDQRALHLWGELNGEIVAYCRIFEPGIKYVESSIGRVCTSTKFRGRGFGRHLLYLAVQSINTCYETSKIRISAQDYLLDFYSDFGFKDTGKKYLEDGLPHTEMLRD